MKLYNGDCLEVMKNIPDKSVDCIICDLPYGTSACDFDKEKINLTFLWKEYKRLIKPNRAIVLFAQQPFTTKLISSNLEMWKYNWVWEKDNGTNFLNSHYQPLKVTEDICVFGGGSTSPSSNVKLFYNPQFISGVPYVCKAGAQKFNSAVMRNNEKVNNIITINNGIRYPKNLIKFNRDKQKLHPTQKPVALIEYLIKTYSNKGDVILDNCMGSGTTGVACYNTGRDFIGIEKDKGYFKLAKERIDNAMAQQKLF